MVDRDVLADSNDNWAEWLKFTADHVEGAETATFGAIRCTSVGAPMPLFNQAFVFEPPVVDDLTNSVRWLAARDVPFWVTAPTHLVDAVSGVAESTGLTSVEGTQPAMVYSPLADLPAVAAGVAEIRRVHEPSELDDVAAVTSEAFGAPLEGARALAPVSMLEDERTAWFVGYVDGHAVACGQLLRVGDVAGIYTIGVRERFRRRGIGEAITHAALQAGRDAGCAIGVLQASPLGAPVYARMGFDTVTHYHHWVAAS